MLLLGLAALFLDDITVVFGIIGAFSESITNFILPGVFLLVTSYQLSKRHASIRSLWYIILGFIVMIFGITYFFTSNYYTIIKLFRQ